MAICEAGTRRMKLGWVAAMAPLWGSVCAHAQSLPPEAPSIEVDIDVGAKPVSHLVMSHLVDAADGCRVAGAPALHQSTPSGVVEMPGGPPTYRLAVADGPDQFSLAALPYRPGQTAFNDASNADLWLTTVGVTWFLPKQPEAGVSVRIAYAADGGSGTFDAAGLVAMTKGVPDRAKARLEIHGRWTCGR